MANPAIEDPLDNEEQLGDQMEALPYMCRLQYSSTQDYLCGLADPLISALQERAASGEQSRTAGWLQHKDHSGHQICPCTGLRALRPVFVVSRQARGHVPCAPAPRENGESPAA